jgi:N-acetylmuramoyl-L-alanine amidase
MRMRTVAATICLATLASVARGEEAAPEFRGAWVTRFEWVSPDAAECRANITRIFEQLSAANFNAAVFQVRGSAETLYPSSIEPWASLIGGENPGFDPVEFAIREAHRCGIAFHAYINAMPMLESRAAPPPPESNHLFRRHGPASSQPWICVDRDGRPCREDYYYMAAGIPEVQAYVRSVITDVVRRYDVEGIHLDRIRYPGPRYSHDAVSHQRFCGRGNPQLDDWADWQRGQLDKLVNDLAAEIRAEKPKLMLSCSAWGIYNRYHIGGYEDFSSGYHDYYQDTWNWCRLGAMDVLMPMIYWNLSDPKPNYDELLHDFAEGVGADHLVGGQRVFFPDENARQFEVSRKTGTMGTVLYSFASADRRGVLSRVREQFYTAKVAPPVLPRLTRPEYGTILGTVEAEDGRPLVDAWVTIRSDEIRRGRRRGSSGPAWTSGADGRFAFLNLRPGTIQVTAAYEGLLDATTETVEVRAGEVARIRIVIRGAAELRDGPSVLVLRPEDGTTTSSDLIHVLGRTPPGHLVKVNGERVEVFGTGAFVKDNVPLHAGENRIEVAVSEGDRRTLRVIRVIRTNPAAASAPTGEAAATRPSSDSLTILEPSDDVALSPGAILTIRVAGPAGRSGEVQLFDGLLHLPLTEAGDKPGAYTATARIPQAAAGRQGPLNATLRSADSGPGLETRSRVSLEVWDPVDVHVAEVASEQAGVTCGLHTVRLGGPWLARLPRGTRFEVIGRQGDSYQIRLSPSNTGWVSRRDVRMLPAGTPVPHNYYESCEVAGRDGEDTLTFGLRAPVAVAVHPAIDPDNRLVIDLFNTHDAMTWISRKSTAKVLGPVRVEQMEEDWVRLTVPLLSRQNWGYWTEVGNGLFTLHVRHPRQLAAGPDSPLKGLLIAVEAGHGGPSNSGAMGLMGTREATVNLEASLALQAELERRGARVIQVRRGDENPGLQERSTRANEAGADFLVCMHANSAGSTRGFLRASGTSTYYHGIHGQLAADMVYRRLLELGWSEFGVVGNFSYTPLRNTRVPALLVEQAFMSHPGDEARLIDPEYQRQQAAAIAGGLEDFFNRIRE